MVRMRYTGLFFVLCLSGACAPDPYVPESNQLEVVAVADSFVTAMSSGRLEVVHHLGTTGVIANLDLITCMAPKVVRHAGDGVLKLVSVRGDSANVGYHVRRTVTYEELQLVLVRVDGEWRVGRLALVDRI